MEFLFGWLVWKFFVHMFFFCLLLLTCFLFCCIVLFLTCMRVVHVQALFGGLFETGSHYISLVVLKFTL